MEEQQMWMVYIYCLVQTHNHITICPNPILYQNQQ